MRCIISQLSRKRSGAHVRKDAVVVGESLRIGRSTNSEIYLSDSRVNFHHASIHEGQDGPHIEAEAGADLRLNGLIVQSARLSVGDRIAVGPYDLTLLETPVDHDLAVSVELIHPLGDDLEKLKERSVLSLSTAGLSRRRWSWLAFVTVILIFLVIPVMAFYFEPLAEGLKSRGIVSDLAWQPGRLASGHVLFAEDCRSCHTDSFAAVSDETCANCHPRTRQHVDPQLFSQTGLTDPSCVSCHHEHNGRGGLIRRAEPACVDCHRDIRQRVPGTRLHDASDFGWHHPEFRLATAMPGDGEVPPVQPAPALQAAPVDQSRLKFPHARHLFPDDPATPLHRQCDGCHRPEPKGPGMQPVSMERHCKQCHTLTFDSEHPDWTLPHASPEEVMAALIDHYAQPAGHGDGKSQIRAPSSRSSAGKGQALPVARDLLEDSFIKRAASVFEGPVCSTCHDVRRDWDKSRPAWIVEPVRIAQRWLPNSNFSHQEHTAYPCTDCHDPSPSSSSADILIPGLSNCRRCHSGDQQDRRVSSTCVDCHQYHHAL